MRIPGASITGLATKTVLSVLVATTLPAPVAGGLVLSYDCSAGGEIGLPLRREPPDPDRLQEAGRALVSSAAGSTDEMVSALEALHLEFCQLEKNGADTFDVFTPEEGSALVEALVRVADLPEVDARRAAAAADLALRYQRYVTDPAARSAARRRAIAAKLAFAAGRQDGDAIAAFFDEQVLLSRQGDLPADPVEILRRADEAAGELSVHDLARVNHLGIQRSLFSLVERFQEPEGSLPGCETGSGESRALLVGIDDYPGRWRLEGPGNDVRLLDKTLRVAAGFEDIRPALDVDRKDLLSAMRALVRDTSCGDRVVFHYSGHVRELEPIWGNGAEPGNSLADQRYLKGWDVALWLREGGLLYAAELSQFITAVRNRGADALLIIDTVHAAALDLGELQRIAGTSPWTGRLFAADLSEDAHADLGSITPLSDRAGEFAVLYAVDPKGMTPETRLKVSESEEAVHGVFTFQLAKELQTRAQDPTVRELLLAVYRKYQAEGRLLTPVLDASSPDLRFFAGKRLDREAAAARSELEIEILSPQTTRGLGTVDTPRLEIVGRLASPERYKRLIVDLEPVELAANGQFSVAVELRPGRNEVKFAAVDSDYVFHTKTIELEVADDLDQLANRGRKYALLIGNQDYVHDDRFPDLATPHRDVDVIAGLLRSVYGFLTTLRSGTGEEHDLVLLDASERQIQATIRLLRDRLTEHDTVLLYYAGHGVYQEEIDRAYWLPVDAEPDAEYTWIKATDLTDTLRQFTARNVLVISDSCYSGAMAKREVPATATLDQDRRRALEKAAVRRSRILISSGGTEPVLDGGGSGHSVFANALISGLRGMDEPIFSSQELYSQFIYPMVQGREHQEPQHKELEQSGHEGGDVILSRVGAAAERAQ